MRLEGDKKIKVLLNSGMVVEMYADSQTIADLKCYTFNKNAYRFFAVRDDHNEVYIAASSIAAFEIIDEQQEATQVQPSDSSST